MKIVSVGITTKNVKNVGEDISDFITYFEESVYADIDSFNISWGSVSKKIIYKRK